MKTKEERKQRLSVTLLFSGIVIIIFISVLLLVGLGLYFFLRLGILKNNEYGYISAPQLILIFGGASVIVGSGLTLLVSRIPLKPVNTLLNIMNRLAAGDFSQRITVPKPWDRHPGIIELTESFNKMAGELESTEMLRSDFINNFSHEFKTPIVSIAGFAKLLKREDLTEKQAEYVRIIEEESVRLSQMANNVLDLTKVENQTILTDVSEYNLSEQLRSCVLLLSSKWEKKETELDLDFSEISIKANKELMKHVWVNLLDNAIKFSGQGGKVGVEIEDQRDYIEVSVSNDGVTIPPEKQQKIFGKFYQADESHAAQGNGVGLAIVKKVVSLHRGSVNVRSGKGLTVFSVKIPKDLPETSGTAAQYH